MAAQLLAQYRDLDCAESHSPALLGDFDAEPALFDHRPPQRGIERCLAGRVRAHPLRRREAVEQLPRTVTERELIFGEIEVHITTESRSRRELFDNFSRESKRGGGRGRGAGLAGGPRGVHGADEVSVDSSRHPRAPRAW